MIEVKGLAAFDSTIQDWFREVEQAAAEAAVGMAKSAFNSILNNSPQFSGDFVANWKVEVGGVTPSFESNVIKGFNRSSPYQVGDSPAISYAKSKAKWPKLKLGQDIYLHNSAFHEEPYAFKIENNQINFRPVNEDAHHVVTRALYATAFLNNPMTRDRLAALKEFGV